MLYQSHHKKGYPHLKSTLAKTKTSSLPESTQQTGRKKRSNSQCGAYNKRPKSTKNITASRKYKAANNQNTIQNEAKLHSISHSIDHTTMISNERPSSVVESLRYAKADRKLGRYNDQANKESISTSIDVPSIELHHHNESFQKSKNIHNHLIYQKAAEMIASNLNRDVTKVTTSNKNSSNSQKVLRSSSRSGKTKSKSKVKQQFKKSGSNFDKSLNKSKDQMHRKSKSDAKKIAYEIFNRNFRTNPKLRKSNYIEKMLNDKALIPRPHDSIEKESPIGIPQSLIVGQINQNWIDNINQQIEENGKNLLDSINKAKKDNSQLFNQSNKKRRKNKQSRPQSSHYVNIQQP